MLLALKSLGFTLAPLLFSAFITHAQQASTTTSGRDHDANQSETQKDGKKRERRRSGNALPDGSDADSKGAPANGSSRKSDEVTIVADSQTAVGDIAVFDGYVDATANEIRLQADHVTYNDATGDMVADGNVIFDQGPEQRVTARRAEINWVSRKGTFWETTGFTNRTQTGEYVYFSAERIEKTGDDTYVLYNATITACEDVIPKWTFTARRADLKLDDRLILHGSVFRVKDVPAFVLPYTWIPVTRSERKSGFLLPTTGSSNQKGRTLKLAYYQTLGKSADVTFHQDIYSQRGLGMGTEFRARTDEESFIRLGVFTVKDRLFGPPGEDQGGTAFFGEGVQYLPHGWLAVGNISVVTSLPFRQVFSDDISQVIDPRRESRFYAMNNTGAYSLSFIAANETTTVFRPGAQPGTGTNFDVKIRQAPEFNLIQYPKQVFGIPLYFSFDSSVGALKREEIADTSTVLVTPAAVQRFDFAPSVTAPLATFGGFAITPTFTFRETFYTNSINPAAPTFNPDRFALNPGDPRLNPNAPDSTPGVELVDAAEVNRVVAQRLSRHYSELTVDLRPPSFERIFVDSDGTRRFKHLVEPYVTYHLIRGIGNDFDRAVRFDDRDAVADTNEVEYAVVNRFFITRATSDIARRRKKRQRTGSPMEPVEPMRRRAKKTEPGVPASGNRDDSKPASVEDRRPEANQKDEPDKAEKAVEAGESPVSQEQAYEVLTVRVAQKYFFDKTFGGALIEGRRNQFYPISTLSGFTFGGSARGFSPLNVAVSYRPLSAVYADLRMDVGSDGTVRDVIVSSDVRTEPINVRTSWYLSRRIQITPTSFEQGTFPGNQVATIVQFGDETKGLYGGARIAYDFTDRFINETDISKGRLSNTRSFIGYGWDCCGVQFNYNTFKAGLRNESNFSFTFTLAGLGSFGTDEFSQLGGGTGGRKRGKRRQADYDSVP
jgi:LPS-assembly protein